MAIGVVSIFTIIASAVFLSLAWRILASLGVGIIVYLSVDAATTEIQNYIDTQLTSLAGVSNAVFQMYGLMNIDVIVNSTIAGFGIYLTLKGLSAGSISKLVFGRFLA